MAVVQHDDRTLITRDRSLANRYPDIVLLESTHVEDQLATLAAAGFDLTISTPTRCPKCNGELNRVPGSRATPEDTSDPASPPMRSCQRCDHLYQQGSHWTAVKQQLETIDP